MFLVAKLKVILSIVVTAAVLIVIIVAMAVPPVPPAETAKKFLEEYGWSVSDQPIETMSIDIPVQWDKVYENYNLLQNQAGFDLAGYKGRHGERITYSVLNFWGEWDVRANVIVFENNVIGGDLSTVSIDGFMMPLEPRIKVEVRRNQ